MTVNLREGYYEELWQSVPEGTRPRDLDLRRAFLLGELRRMAGGDEQTASSDALRVLDVGCGEAQLTEAIARAGHRVIGIDVAEEPLRRARRRDAGLDLRRVEAGGAWPLDDASFDAVWAGETIEHVLDTARWMSELRRVLRSGGIAILTTPAHGPLRRLGLALSARHFARHFDPRSDHVRFYTRGALVRLIEEFGFERVRAREAGGPPGARRTLLASAVRARF